MSAKKIDFVIFLNKVSPLTIPEVMSMNAESWENVNISRLQLNHALTSVTIAAITPTVTATNVTPSEIQANSFLKYCNIRLLDKINIRNVYKNLVIQAAGFHVFLRPSEKIPSYRE